MDEPARSALFGEVASTYARVALDNVRREYPTYVFYVATDPGLPPAPRDLHPAFYGSYDWHSCVAMHWLLVRLLRLVPEAVPQDGARATLAAHLAPGPLAGEVAFFANPAHRTIERPYGWGWLLALAAELGGWDDPDGRSWAANLTPLVDLLAERFRDWLPRQTYPVRHGLHANSAFGLSRALPFAAARARAGDDALLTAIRAAADRWFAADADYPAAWEPSGSDFLSPALTEAEVMASLLPPPAFAAWLDRFLPAIAHGQPATLFTPATVSDDADGQIAHLHGLNLSRAWCWRRLVESLPPGDPRIQPMEQAAARHAEAALPRVAGSDYMVEHWLAFYAALYLS
jgi:hypothetical protein